MVLSYPILSDAYRAESGDRERVSAVDRVLGLITRECPWDYDLKNLFPLQLEAFNERLRDRRTRVPVLDQLAAQLSIEEAQSPQDVVSLMFDPAVYRSYPTAFVTRGRWRQLLGWLDSLSSFRFEGVDLDGCVDADDFNLRIRNAGYHAMNTNSASGKPSFYPESPLDHARIGELITRTFDWMLHLGETGPRPIFYTANLVGTYGGHSQLGAIQRAFGRPDAMFGLLSEPLKTAEVSRLAYLGKAATDGTASEPELEELRELNELSRQNYQAGIDRFATALVEHAHEPILLGPLVYVAYLAMRRIKETVGSVEFHPQGAIWLAGSKNSDLMPADYMDEIRDFYKLPVRQFYGQSELQARYAECDLGRMHVPPNIMLHLLDPRTREPLETGTGTVEGVAASFDVSIDGRWGGLVSPDVLKVDFEPCPCGLRSPTLLSINGADATVTYRRGGEAHS